MFFRGALHPLYRYGLILLLFLAALGTVAVSWQVNPHSTSWLIGIYTTVVLFLAAMRSRRKSPLHRSYALYLAMFSLYLMVVWLLFIHVPGRFPEEAKARAAFWAWIFYPGLIFNAPALLHFTLRFSEVRAPLWRWIEALGWLVSCGYVASNALDRFVLDYIWVGCWFPTMEGAYGHFFPFTTFFLTLSVVVPLYKIFTVRSRQRRMQLTWYLLGAAPLWFACWSNFLISKGFKLYPAGGIFFLVHAAIMAYAVFKQRVFDFTLVIRRGLAYAVVSLVLGMLYGLILWSLPVGQVQAGSGNEVWPGIFFVLAVGFLFAPLLGYFQKIVDRFFFREATDRQRMMDTFAREIAATIDLARVAESLCGLLSRGLKPKRVRFYLLNDAGRPILYAVQEAAFRLAHEPEGEGLPAELASQLRPGNAIQRIRAAPEHAGPRPIEMSAGDEALCVPVAHRNERLGVLLIDPKVADELYDDEEVRWAEVAAAHASVALLNARSFTQLKHLQELELAAQRREGLARVGEMISAINHEIKNIVQPIQYQMQRMEEPVQDEAARRRSLAVVTGRLAALNRLLDNLRDLARPIELRKRPLEIQALLASTWRDVQELPLAQGVHFEARVAPETQWVTADGHWLRQVLYNLMKNAAEATQARPSREVRAEVAPEGERIRIEVRDNGCGIEPEALVRLFEPFYSTKAEAGTGLGLSISRKVIELHDGSLDACSRQGGETVFSICLPRDQADGVSCSTMSVSLER